MYIVIFKPKDLRLCLKIYNKSTGHIHFTQLFVVITHILPSLNTDKAVFLRIVLKFNICTFFIGEYIKFKVIISLLTRRNCQIPSIFVRLCLLEMDKETFSRTKVSKTFGTVELLCYPCAELIKLLLILFLLLLFKKSLI
jgi:hypothetical protein